MSDLSEITIYEIETKIMSILYRHIDIVFNQFTLFNKLINDKYDLTNTKTIHPNFKAKFLLVLRNLEAKFKDIKVNKHDNNIYSVVCYSNPDNIKELVKDDVVKKDENELNNISYNDLVDFIIKNKYDSKNNFINNYEYIDPFDGNTIFHDLIITNNIAEVTKLIKTKNFDYFIKNKHDETPLELCTNKELYKLLVMGLLNKYYEDIEFYNNKYINNKLIINNYEDKIIKYESDQYKIDLISETFILELLWIKLYTTINKNKIIVISIIVLFLSWILFF
jgi:hypothetical protein